MTDLSPPKFLLRFLKWFCDPDLHPFIEGDLHELYQVGISFWVFFLVGAGLLLLTLIIVGVQTVRAALANPINAIRLE